MVAALSARWEHLTTETQQDFARSILVRAQVHADRIDLDVGSARLVSWLLNDSAGEGIVEGNRTSSANADGSEQTLIRLSIRASLKRTGKEMKFIVEGVANSAPVFAVAIANDFSARDVQLPQMQFFKGKSYRGFCPIGPWLTVPDPDEFARLDDLELQLTVNDAVRQRDSTRNLVFKPAETISELSTFANIAPGDVLLTGTPCGCALRLPPAPIRRIVQLLPERQFWKLFLNAQRRRAEYLRPGDSVAARIFSADGTLDLGEQTTAVLAAA